MAKTRTPSLAAPSKAVLEIKDRFVTKVHDHAAIQADPLLKAQAEWLRGLLDDFSALATRRAKEQADG